MRAGRLSVGLLCLVIVTPVLFGLWAPGCGTAIPLAGDLETGTLKLWITDKPFPFEFIEQALVTVTRVELRRADDAAPDDAPPFAGDVAAEEQDGDDPFLVVFEQEGGKDFNLLDLRNGRMDLLASAEVPAGRYSLIRLIVTQGTIRLRDGRAFTLRVPGGGQTGIKLHCAFDVRPGEEATLLLDVDLSRAFSPVPAGRPREAADIESFRFSPSLAMRVVRLAEVGSMGGTVRDPNGHPIPVVAVTAFAGDTEVTTASTEDDGAFVLSGLPPGLYRVAFSADGYQDASLDGVAVSAGQATALGDVALQPAPAAPAAAARLAADGSPALVNYALHAPVTLHGTFFSTQYYIGTASDPQTVVDGVFLPRRTRWDLGTLWWLTVGGFLRGQYLTIDLGGPRRIESFVVQTHSREAFVLSYWDADAQAWKVAWDVPKGDATAYGMETRPDPRDNTARYGLPSPIITSQLMFAAPVINGTHMFSVSEIQAYGRPANSPPVAHAGGPYVSAATSWQGSAVTLDGGASTDPDGDTLAYSWTIGDEEIGTTAALAYEFPIGETEVSLTVTDPAGATATARATVTVTAIEATIDLKPGCDANSVNLGSKGAIPVAFLTDEACDAAAIDPATVTFAGHPFAGFVKMRGKGKQTPMADLEDVDSDGDLDLVVHLQTASLPLNGTETIVTIGALTRTGLLVRGQDRIQFVPR